MYLHTYIYLYIHIFKVVFLYFLVSECLALDKIFLIVFFCSVLANQITKENHESFDS